MATYKVPQDVEADDKLLGPFSFRQFIYLMIVLGLAMLAIGLFQIYPILAIIPLPFALFFIVLALPIKKDQPMETYLAALWSFYTKPSKRYWLPGQSNSTILITTPKKIEAPRARDISADEAGHRLSFLADIVDTEGQAIKNASTPMKDEFYAEAYNTTDMFDHNNYYNTNFVGMTAQPDAGRAAVIEQMRNAIAQSDYSNQSPTHLPGQRIIQPRDGFSGSNHNFMGSGAPGTISGFESPAVVQPLTPGHAATTNLDHLANPDITQAQMNALAHASTPSPTPEEVFRPEHSTNNSRPVENIQQQADRIRRENESEVYVSLH